jgi:hypothetical protein
VSEDRGRTWGERRPIVERKGDAFDGWRSSVARLKSGKLGIAYNAIFVIPERDGDLWCRTSDDEGESWFDPVVIDPLAAVVRNGTMRVLQSWRILCPVFNWISPAAAMRSRSTPIATIGPTTARVSAIPIPWPWAMKS